MQVKASDEWNRRLVVVNIPTEDERDLSTLDITIGYVSPNACGDCHKAVTLDHKVIPQITKAVNCHDALVSSLKEMVDMFERHVNGKPGPDDEAQRWDRALSILELAMKPKTRT